MTIADLDKMERVLESRLVPWVRQASGLISRHLADARAHATKALTDTLKLTTDGRPSARKVLRSPSYQSAGNRLRTLQDALIGPASDSLDGLIRDARAAFYRNSIELWTPVIPAEYRVTADPAPTKMGESLMRGAIIHGFDLARELSPSIKQTSDQLFVVLNSAGRRKAGLRVGDDLIKLWHAQSVARLNRKVASILSDSDKAIHEATGWLIIAPEYRGEREFSAGGLHF